jgi:DNA mismatch repair protein MutS
LFIDAKTRRDLELFRTREGAQGVVDLLDLAQTSGGSRALRTRFENPSSDPDLIRQVQDGIRFLVKGDLSFPVPPGLVEDVARYLESSWDVGSNRRGLRFLLDVAVVQLRYRALLRFARDGVGATALLLEHLLPFLEDLLDRAPPEGIERLAEALLGLGRQLWGGNEGTPRRATRVLRQDRHLRKELRAAFRELMELLFDLDALMAMGEGVKRFGLVFPELVDSPHLVLEGEGIFHLFLDEPVPNPVDLPRGERLIFLTGPNMAGKTTYLKAVSISVYLAHVGMGVPAASLRLSPLDALFASLTPEENIREGLSYFMAEVRRVREVAEAVAGARRALVVFDEVFRGTNVKDAFDASRLVILGFARQPHCRSLFSSHLVELAEDLAHEPGIRLTCFEGGLQEGRAVYDYRLKEGVSDQRFGLYLLEQEGVPKLLS